MTFLAKRLDLLVDRRYINVLLVLLLIIIIIIIIIIIVIVISRRRRRRRRSSSSSKRVKILEKWAIMPFFGCSKILRLKLSSEQIFS